MAEDGARLESGSELPIPVVLVQMKSQEVMEGTQGGRMEGQADLQIDLRGRLSWAEAGESPARLAGGASCLSIELMQRIVESSTMQKLSSKEPLPSSAFSGDILIRTSTFQLSSPSFCLSLSARSSLSAMHLSSYLISRRSAHLLARAMSTSPESLILSTRSSSNHVAILTLNRPKALNALSSPLFAQLNEELDKAGDDDSVRAVVITGGDKVFAAGADIKEMKDKDCRSS